MSLRWMQTKIYQCPACQATYVHDKAYMHELFVCPNRKSLAPSHAASGKPVGP